MSSAGGGQEGKPASSEAAQSGGTSQADQAAVHEHSLSTTESAASTTESAASTSVASTATAVASPVATGDLDSGVGESQGDSATSRRESQGGSAVVTEKSRPGKRGRVPKPREEDAAGQGSRSGERKRRGGGEALTKVGRPFRFLTRPPFSVIARPFAWTGRSFCGLWRHNWFRHVVLLLVYIAAGIGATWPRFTYLTEGKLPRTTDVASFVWGFWWVAHQVSHHFGNPFFTKFMAAPAGIQLGFSTLMPLAGYVMTPVTLLWGPSASFTVLSLIAPGLLCYTMYRAARLWLNQLASIVAGAMFGLSSMLMWQNWYHLNIALGIIFLPMVIEATVRLRRTQKIAPAVYLGITLGGAVMTSQEGAAIALLLTAAMLVPWIVGKLFRDRESLVKALIPLGIGAVVALVVASPQLIAMAQQYLSGGAAVPPGTLALNYTQFGVPLQTLFSPSPRISYYGLHSLPSGYAFNAAQKGGSSVQPGEGLPGFGLIASALAVIGILIGWRKKYRYAWWFALLWLGCAVLSLGTSIVIGSRCVVNQSVAGELYGRSCIQLIPFKSHIHWVQVVHDHVATWEQVRVSNLMPYTWLVRIPWLAGLREADRFALVGMIGVALLAGIAVQWLSQRRRWMAVPAIIVVAALAVVELGWQGGTDGPNFTPTEVMPTGMPWLDAPIQADPSHSIVLDVPWGLRGGLSLIGSGISERVMLLATEDGHPRAVSYTAWVPQPTIKAVKSHAFYWYLMKMQNATRPPTDKELKAAAADLKTLHIGWAIEWRNLWRQNHPEQRLNLIEGYLRDLGFKRVRETCLVPTAKPRPVCGGVGPQGHPLEEVWLLKYVPAWAYKNPGALERRLHPCTWFWQHHPGVKHCPVPKSRRS